MSSNSPASGAAERRGPGATPTERCSRRHVHPTGELTPPDLTGQVAGRVRGALQRVPAPSQPGAAAAAGTQRGPSGCQRPVIRRARVNGLINEYSRLAA